MITVPQTQTNLLAYFQTGDVPTADQYAEFIGTMFYLYNQTVANATAAAASAADADASLTAALARLPAVLARFTMVSGSAAFVGTTVGVSGITTDGSNYKVAFTTPFADTNYKILFFAKDGSSLSTVIPAVVNAGYIEFVESGTGFIEITLAIWP